jgi:hypothetical protein
MSQEQRKCYSDRSRAERLLQPGRVLGEVVVDPVVVVDYELGVQ